MKTGAEIRHDAKERVKQYRKDMRAKGYISTTIFLSQQHRDELKRLGDEERLTRAEAAEHIFNIYLQYNNKTIIRTTQEHRNHTTESASVIDSLEQKIKQLEERDAKRDKEFSEILSKMNVIFERQSKPVIKPKQVELFDVPPGPEHIPANDPSPDTIPFEDEADSVKILPPEMPELKSNHDDNMPPQLLPDGKNNPAYEAWLFHRIIALRESGLSWLKVMEQLNSDGALTIRGKKWGRGNAQAFYKRVKGKIDAQPDKSLPKSTTPEQKRQKMMDLMRSKTNHELERYALAGNGFASEVLKERRGA